MGVRVVGNDGGDIGIIAGADGDFPDLRIERRRAGGGSGGVERQPGLDRAQAFAAHVFELAVPDRLVEQVALPVEFLTQLGPDQEAQSIDAPLGLHLRRGGIGLVEIGAAGDVGAVRARPGPLVRRDGGVQIAGELKFFLCHVRHPYGAEAAILPPPVGGKDRNIARLLILLRNLTTSQHFVLRSAIYRSIPIVSKA